MKIEQITEATYENLEVLKELAKITYEHIADSGGIRDGEIKTFGLSQIPEFTELYKQYQDHPKFSEVFQIMETTEIKIVDDPEYEDAYYGKNPPYGGYWSSRDNLIVIFSFNTRRITKALVHEFRHLFQSVLYGKYADGPIAHKEKYESRQIELDATWHDIIGEYDVSDFSYDPEDYANTVMDEMNHVKNLSPKMNQHYKRKTLKYFTDYINKILIGKLNQILAKNKKYLEKYPPLTQEELVDELNSIVDNTISDLNNYSESEMGLSLTTNQTNYFKNKSRKELTAALRPVMQQIKTKQYIKKYEPVWEQIVNNTVDSNLNIKNYHSYMDKVLNKLVALDDIFNAKTSVGTKVLQYFYDKTNQLLFDISLQK